MSGRLVILPHKKWNVWNQDNREKVLRDERLNNEKEQLKIKTEQNLLSEYNYELLTKANILDVNHQSAERHHHETNITIDNIDNIHKQDDDITPFRLFEDLEMKYNQQSNTNEEYMKEKLLKDKKQKQRDGIDPWALGDGSYEYKKAKPWYTNIKTENPLIKTENEFLSNINDNNSSGIDINQYSREIDRKIKADPMSKILKIDKQSTLIDSISSSMHSKTSTIHNIISKLENNNSNNTMIPIINATTSLDQVITIPNPITTTTSTTTTTTKDDIVLENNEIIELKINKKHKKHHHKHKRNEHNKVSEKYERSSKYSNTSTSTGDVSITHNNSMGTRNNQSHDSSMDNNNNSYNNDNKNNNNDNNNNNNKNNDNNNNNNIWDDLRQKRLERETMERKKSMILFTQRDIYGSHTNITNKSNTTSIHNNNNNNNTSNVSRSFYESYNYGQQYNPHLAKK